ncbi:hypothetical protein OXV74_19765 [Bacteroides thetaiotaomicron]|nr:hypothetical protein [Bacteroides thetaiotaomicron]
METSKQKEYTFLQKLLNKANMGWWEADLKTESYVCSEFISRLLQSPNQKIPDRKTKCVIKTHINIKQNVIFGAKLKPV